MPGQCASCRRANEKERFPRVANMTHAPRTESVPAFVERTAFTTDYVALNTISSNARVDGKWRARRDGAIVANDVIDYAYIRKHTTAHWHPNRPWRKRMIDSIMTINPILETIPWSESHDDKFIYKR